MYIMDDSAGSRVLKKKGGFFVFCLFLVLLPHVTIDITWKIWNFQEPLLIHKPITLELNIWSWHCSQNIEDARFPEAYANRS